MTTSPISIHSSESAALLRKISRHIIPFCALCYFFNYLDRLNIAIARMPMSADPFLGKENFNQHVFAVGVAIFFLGYCSFEIPSNLLQQKVGARRWIARIMISWGIISACFLFTQGPKSFYSLRLLLGLAEAGFFPGIILYLSAWIPHHHRARAGAIFLTSTAIAGVLGNVVSGSILYYAQDLPWLRAWQWLFLLEGLPTIVLGIIVLFVLKDSPKDAHWLSDSERAHLKELLDQDQRDHPSPHLVSFRHAFTPTVFLLSLLYGLHSFGFYACNFWTPKLIEDALTSAGTITTQTPDPLKHLHVALLSAIPFGCAAVGMVLIARSSDKHNERKYHLVFALTLAATGLTLAALAPRFSTGMTGTVLTIIGLSMAATGAFGSFGPFWALPNSLLTSTAAATAIALINSIGNFCGGYIGANTIDALKGTPPFANEKGFLLAAALQLAGIILLLAMPLKLSRDPAPSSLAKE